MQIENIAGISFTSRRASQQQRNFTIGRSLLRKIVVDRQRVLAAIAKVLAHRRAGIGREILHGRRVGRSSRDHDRVVHRSKILKRLYDLRYRRSLLTDCHIDADNVFATLIDDRIDCDRGFSGLSISDD